MKNVVLDEVKKNLNWRERVIFMLFKKVFCKVYNMARIITLNNFLNK